MDTISTDPGSTRETSGLTHAYATRTGMSLRKTFTTAIAAIATILTAVTAVAFTASPVSAAQPEFLGQTPTRIVDTRPSQGSYPRGTLRSGDVMEVNVRTTSPVALNVTAVGASNPGYLAAYPCDTGFEGTSSVNFAPGGAIANMALLQAGPSNTICVYAYLAGNVGTVDVVIDQTGVFKPGGAFTAAAPERKADTRWTTGGFTGRKLAAGTEMRVTGLAPNAGHVLNLTVTQPEANGFLTAYPCAAGRPNASNSNFVPGQTKATMGVVKADASGRICIWTLATTHVVVDHFGRFTGAAEFITPTRVMNTRNNSGHIGAYYKGQSFKVRFPDAAGRAVALNVTVTQPDGPGFVTAYPCDQNRPNASMLNYTAGQTIPNGIVIQPSPTGDVCFWSYSRTELVVDLAGYIGAKTTTTTTTTTTVPGTTTTTVPGTTTTTTVPGTTTTTTVPGNDPCAVVPSTPVVTISGYPAAEVVDITADFVACLNARRAAAGVVPVIACPKLAVAARYMAADDAQNRVSDHSMSNGSNYAFIALEQGYQTYWTVQDNAGGPAPADTTIGRMVNQEWANSTLHNNVQMGAKYLTVGAAVGFNTSTGSGYWHADFGVDATC